jgi:tetratricopeptide (TPR) repeat protein
MTSSIDDYPIDVLMEYRRLWEDGQTHEAHSRNKKAILCYQQMIDLTEEDPVLYNCIATCYMYMNDMEKCEKALRQGLELDPDEPQLLMNLSLVLLDTQRENEAEQVARRVLNTENEEYWGPAYLRLGDALLEQDKLFKGLEALLEAQKLMPDNPEVHHLLGRAYFTALDAENANEHFTRAVELQPDNAILLKDYGEFLNACGLYKKAETVLRLAVEADPFDHLPLVHLAESIIEQVKEDKGPAERVDEATKLLNDSLSRYPGEGKTWLLWGMISLMHKDWESVEMHMKACLMCDYDDPRVYMFMCAAKGELGDEEAAERVFKKFKRKNRLELAKHKQMEKQYKAWKEKRGIA